MSFLRSFFGKPQFALPIAGMLLMTGITLVFSHAVVIRQLKDIGLPAAMALPQMQQRLVILRDQVEASELQESMRAHAAQEQLPVYVLPEKLNLERLLALFDVLGDNWRMKGWIRSLSPITVGNPVEVDGHHVTPVTFEADVTQEGRDLLLLLVRFSGRLTVNDALSGPERSALIDLTEQENPAALTVLEQFLATDLLKYAQESQLHERQVLRSITSSSFEEQFKAIISRSGLAKARYLLGGETGQLLKAHNLWPSQMMGLKNVEISTISGGRYFMKVEVEAYTK